MGMKSAVGAHWDRGERTGFVNAWVCAKPSRVRGGSEAPQAARLPKARGPRQSAAAAIRTLPDMRSSMKRARLRRRGDGLIDRIQCGDVGGGELACLALAEARVHDRPAHGRAARRPR